MRCTLTEMLIGAVQFAFNTSTLYCCSDDDGDSDAPRVSALSLSTRFLDAHVGDVSSPLVASTARSSASTHES